jgi:hypothetical protein
MPAKSIVLFAALLAAGCSNSSPVQPDAGSGDGTTALVVPDPGSRGGRPLTVTLTTEAEVPECTEPAPPGRGTAVLTLNSGLGQVCWVIDVQDVNTNFVGAHIHRAPAGEPGGIVVPVQTPDASGHSEGCTTADRALVKDILQNPEAYYLNIHNVDCPPGVARGQLGD